MLIHGMKTLLMMRKFVIYGQTKWQAMTDVNPGVTPGAPYDPDGDGVDNGNHGRQSIHGVILIQIILN